MRRGLIPRITAVTLAIALLVGAIVLGLTLAVVSLRDAGRESAGAERKIAAINRLERTVIDLETGQRGFLIDGDGRFLEPYTDARAALPDILTYVDGVADDPTERRLARRLVDGIRTYERDFAVPIVDLAGRDLPAARRRAATGEGKAIVDRLRLEFDRLVAQEQSEATAIRESADSAGRRGVVLGIIGAVASFLLVLGFGASLVRTVVRPVRRLAHAVTRVGRGDLETEVVARGAGEVGELERGFNAMARALQEHHDELEGQTAEVEAQRDDLERTFAELEDEKAWIETLFGFTERLMGEDEVDDVARRALREVTDHLGGDAGVLWAVRTGEDQPLDRLAVLGVDPARLPERLDTATGVAGRAVAERRPIHLAHADTGLQLDALGGPARVSHELHLPLFQGDELLGIVTVGRVVDRPFGDDEVGRARRMTDQVAVVLAKAIESRRVARLVAVNAAVLDATSFGIGMFDRQGQLRLANRRLREMWDDLGISADADMEERGARMVELAVDPDDARAEVRKVGEDPAARARVELHDPETGRWYVGRTDPVAGPAGEQIGRMVSMRDSTAEHEIQRMRDEFVATVTHELRTPLSSVVAAVDLLEDETEEPSSGQRHWTGMIRRNVDRLLRLVDDLLTVARAESGEFTLHPTACDLAVIASDAAASAGATAEAKGVGVQLAVVPAPLRADTTRLAQVCDNLIANAVKFTPAGGVVRVQVRPGRAAGEVVLEVADSGIGIPPEDREHLFERFYRAPAATDGAIPGTGLGLTITKAIVEAHGGSISVADGLDGGTAFVVVLPAAGPPER
jgi:signal transduction histidine kinase